MKKNESIYSQVLELAKTMNWKILTYSATNITLLSFIRGKDVEVYKIKDTTRGYIRSAALSSDFAKIAFGIVENNPAEHRSDEYIYIIKLDNLDSDKRRLLKLYTLAEGNSICWSPDDMKIAFVGKLNKEDDRSLYIVDIKTGKTELLVNGNIRGISSQAWSTDGKEIVYENTKSELIVYNLEKKLSRYLISKAYYPTWYGNWIAYRDAIDGNYYLIQPNGSKKRLLIKNKPSFSQKLRLIGRIMGPLTWSPDGKFFLYARHKGFSLDVEIPTLFIMEMSSGREEQLPK